jgi:hypothetical protein
LFVATVDFSSIGYGQASGSISGTLSYAYTEFEDPYSYPVSGGGPFAGSITANEMMKIANVTYTGSSNWCTSYSGTATMIGQ